MPAAILVSADAPFVAALIALTTFVWMAFVSRTHAIRGWTVRLPAETVADLIRTAFPITIIGAAIMLLMLTLVPHTHENQFHPWAWWIGINLLTFLGLTFQALFRRGRPASWVRIVGSPSNLGAAVGTFDQCMDLLGRDGCRFAPFRADKPDLNDWERRITTWLDRGETVLVLEPQLQTIAKSLRRHGDVILAHDAVLFTSMSNPAGPFTDVILAFMNKLLAAVGLLFIWPIILIIAILIKLDDDGPILFTQQRAGKDNKHFELYKFRSMRIDAPKYAVHPGDDDPRITTVGKWLRRFSLDELPQLLNVLRGDMRIVGPRPEMPFIVKEYNDIQRTRMDVTPGITGLWQVSPHRNDPIHEHMEYDLAYIAHRSPTLDLALIIATAGLASTSGK